MSPEHRYIRNMMREAHWNKLIVAKWEKLFGTPFVGNINDPDDKIRIIHDITNHKSWKEE